ncbi:MAG: hypothetical protein PSW75_11440 [bacterium]|nr:hypothetical protein [bacterium]MDI1337336.1 hypothetical protein [Lacunisphaera sp.]
MPTKLLILLSALLLVTAGCGRKSSQKTTVGGVTVEQKGDDATVEFKGKDGEPGMKIMSNEKGGVLPAEFPKDVPIFKDALVVSAYIAGDAMQVQTTFKAPLEEGMKFYEEKMKVDGWEVSVMKMEMMNMVTAKKGQRQCTVMFSTEDNLTVASISTNVAGK